MAGLPNSSNALQQWHHLFEAEGTKRSPQAQQHLQQLLRTGLPTRKHENWKYTPLEGLTVMVHDKYEKNNPGLG